MPIFELAGEQPEFPADGQYWIAETALASLFPPPDSVPP